MAPVGDDEIIWLCLLIVRMHQWAMTRLFAHASKGKFTVTSFWRKVCEGSSNLAFPADAIWRRSKVPTKACFSAWAATKGKVPTKDKLQRRNFNLTSRCPMCLQEEELVDRLFVYCRCVSMFWHLSFSLLGGQLGATSHY